MTPTEVQSLLDELKAALEKATETATFDAARQQLEALQARLDAQNHPLAPVVQLLWHECLAARRSALFWQELSNAEKSLADGMAEKNIQLKQNYMRLVQEQ
ncbi:MAG: hypothetical protein AAFQ61_13085 [Cyanobacteria bacterium J06626_23]